MVRSVAGCCPVNGPHGPCPAAVATRPRSVISGLTIPSSQLIISLYRRCEIKRTHASFPHVVTSFPAVDAKKYAADKLVKGRCESAQIVQVAEAVAGIKGMPLEEVMAAAYANSARVFFKR